MKRRESTYSVDSSPDDPKIKIRKTENANGRASVAKKIAHNTPRRGRPKKCVNASKRKSSVKTKTGRERRNNEKPEENPKKQYLIRSKFGGKCVNYCEQKSDDEEWEEYPLNNEAENESLEWEEIASDHEAQKKSLGREEIAPDLEAENKSLITPDYEAKKKSFGIRNSKVVVVVSISPEDLKKHQVHNLKVFGDKLRNFDRERLEDAGATRSIVPVSQGPNLNQLPPKKRFSPAGSNFKPSKTRLKLIEERLRRRLHVYSYTH